MKVTILDGSQADDRTGKDVSQILRQNLAKRDDEVSYFLLRDEKIGNCAGDFFCWVRYPGQCMINDVNREIAAAVATTDLLVYLTPITFGGYSSELKSMVDHQIQNIAPFFARVNGESHHQKRYDRYPDFLVIGWGAKSKDEETVFRNLVRRNQLNFYSQNAVAGIIPDGFPLAEMEQKVAGWLQEINRFHSLTDIVLPADEPQARQWAPVRRSVLLVGSPKTRKSSSHFLGSYLQDQLAQQGVETETFFVHTTLKNVAKWQAVLDAVDKADLVTLTYPLYVDSLPAPMIEALERIAAHRQDGNQHQAQRLAAIANCGFPEAQHNQTSLAICCQFAFQAGFDWVGGLALGGGQGAVRGKPLGESGGQVARIRKAIEIAGASLMEGGIIPVEAREMMAVPFIPKWMYLGMAGIGWRLQARQYGVHRQIRSTPYA